MKKSYLLALLCIPMVISAGDNGGGIGQLPVGDNQMQLALLAQAITDGFTGVARAIRPEGPKNFSDKCIKVGEEAFWEGTKVVAVAVVMLIAESARRQWIVDLVKNEDWDTHCKVAAAGERQYNFCNERIKELIEQQKGGLTPEQESHLAQYKEDAQKLEDELAKNRQETIKRLPKEQSHKGTMFNRVMYPLAKLLPS